MEDYDYKSPIDIIYGEIQLRMENEIMRAVQKVDINVDKDELIKALAYDRGQYERGFRDGERMQWIPVVDELPKEHGYYLVQLSYTHQPFRIAYYDGDVWSEEYEEECCSVILSGVAAWMPLPELYEEEWDAI